MTVKVKYRIWDYKRALMMKLGEVSRDEAPKLVQEIDRQSPEGFRGTFSVKHTRITPEGRTMFATLGHKLSVVSSYQSKTGGGRELASNPAIAIYVKEFGRPAIVSNRPMPIRISKEKANELLWEAATGYTTISEAARRRLESDEPVMFRRRVKAVPATHYISNIFYKQWLHGFVGALERGIKEVIRDMKHSRGSGS
jgi:hypothetical protein